QVVPGREKSIPLAFRSRKHLQRQPLAPLQMVQIRPHQGRTEAPLTAKACSHRERPQGDLMRSVTTFAAAAIALAVALPAAAQTADSASGASAPAEAAASGAQASDPAAPAGAATSGAAAGGATSAPAAVGGNVTVGQSVKDNTG